MKIIKLFRLKLKMCIETLRCRDFRDIIYFNDQNIPYIIKELTLAIDLFYKLINKIKQPTYVLVFYFNDIF